MNELEAASPGLKAVTIYKTSEPFREVQKFLDKVGYKGDLYFTSERILSANEYCTIDSRKKMTYSVLIDSNGKVIYVESPDDSEELLRGRIDAALGKTSTSKM